MRFHATDTKIFEFKHPSIIETMYCLLNRDRTAQWQQLKVSFTLPESNLFSKTYSVANSHPKCASGFFTERTFMVQMFSSPTTSCKTVKGSLRTLFRKYLRAPLWVTTAFHFELLGAPKIEWEREWSCGWDFVCGWSRQIQLKPQAFGQHSAMWTILRLQESTQASENSRTTTVERIETNIDSNILPHHTLCEIPTIYPITVDNYPTPLFYAVYGTR